MDNAALEERYPQLHFLAMGAPVGSFDEEAETLSLDGVDVLYVYGINDAYSKYQLWLKAHPERDLVFLEEDLAAIKALPPEAYKDPQVHVRYLLPGSYLPDFANEVASEFPFHRIAFTSSKRMNPSRAQRLKLLIKRKVALHHALFSERFYHHELFKNLLPNYLRFPGSASVHQFKDAFKGVPAIICGAGPSLNDSIEQLKKLDKRALILAGGSTITALSTQEVIPHIGMAIDPNPEEYDRLEPNCAFEMPLIYGSRLLPKTFETLNSPLAYLRSFTGGPSEFWLENQLGVEGEPLEEKINPEALSVTTSLIGLAKFMGCDPIILVGVDLAFTNNQRYARGVVADSAAHLEERAGEVRAGEKMVYRKDREGRRIHTLVKWVMEASWIGAFARKNRDREFINAGSGGLPIKGIPYQNLDDIRFDEWFDLRGQVHHTFFSHPLGVTEAALRSELVTLKESLKKVVAILDETVGLKADHPLIALYETELSDEIAYQILLEGPADALKRKLQRRHREDNPPQFWNYLKTMADSLLEVFDKNRL